MKHSILSSALRALFSIGLMRFGAVEGEGGGSTSFSREYVSDLREEAKSWRLKAQAAESKIGELTAALDKANSEAKASADGFEAKLKQLTEESEARVKKASADAADALVRAKIESAATKAGMVDLDGLKLADLSKVKLKDDGSLEGADDALKALKEAKPYLFGVTGNSSSPVTPPSPSNQPKHANEMSDAEYAAALAQMRQG